MGKRFIDTELNRKSMRGVDVKLRFAFDWLWANCDHAGVWQTDAELFKFEAGYKLDVQGLLKSCPRVEMLPNGNLFLLDFIGVNHGVLKPDYNPHKPVFRSLAANGIEPLTLKFQPLANPSSRVVVEVEDVVVDTQGSKECAHEAEVEPTFSQWFDLYDKRNLAGIVTISGVDPLDDRDVLFRLEEFRDLKNGWNNGSGKETNRTILQLLMYLWSKHSIDDAYVYPTEQGGVKFEWDGKGGAIELAINPGGLAELFFETEKGDFSDVVVPLTTEEDWLAIANTIKPLLKS